jgi:hypothetical protein
MHGCTLRQNVVFCNENRLRFLVHSSYSPDLAPSDLFLFEHTKHYVQGSIFASANELLKAIERIVSNIPNKTLREYNGAGGITHPCRMRPG